MIKRRLVDKPFSMDVKHGKIVSIEDVDSKYEPQSEDEARLVKYSSGYKISTLTSSNTYVDHFFLIEDWYYSYESWGYLCTNNNAMDFIGAKMLSIEESIDDGIEKYIDAGAEIPADKLAAHAVADGTYGSVTTAFTTIKTDIGNFQLTAYTLDYEEYRHPVSYEALEHNRMHNKGA